MAITYEPIATTTLAQRRQQLHLVLFLELILIWFW
jgi:hypothetical protein